MKILILKVKTIGDTLLITPLVSNLYRYYDNPAIEVMVSGKHRVISDVRACLPCNNDGCDNNLVSDCFNGVRY